ncbi:hypothetical protein Atai01_56150 [Amycolatopsis taiwanensis]|uniref:Uncharacterized protein n=1 Tax=Amycolatopsis taiwanensis TaxID=342230 RepID=A0A9W6R3U2_9PSEU|nr:hypothetical protein Atai01_56150 [Amycolatopsis taiwanensis]
MSGPVSRRSKQGDQHARAPKARYRGGGAPCVEHVTRSRMERPVDTIKGVWGLAPSWGVGAEPPQGRVARKLAEETA